MAVNLSPIGGVAAQFFDNSGNILSGGKIFTYAAGTTTPQASYTSASGVTAHANPIILDAAGRVPSGEIWLTDGLQYKFLIKTSADVQIGSYDNIIGINSNFVNYTNSQEFQTATAGQTVFTLTTMVYQPGTGSLSVFVDGVNQYGPGALYAYQETSDTVVTFTAGLHVGAQVKFTTSAINASSYGDAEQISYTPPFASSVATNVEAKLAQYVSVNDFGAVGDGVTDDTAALAAAFAASKQLYFPSGTYLVDASGYPTKRAVLYSTGNNDIVLSGYGATIKYKDAASGPVGLNFVELVNAENAVIEGFTFDGNRQNQIYGYDGVALFGGKNLTVRDVVIKNMYRDGVYVRGSTPATASTYPDHVLIDNVVCDACGRNGASIIGATNITIQNSIFRNTVGDPGAGIDVEPNASDIYGVRNLRIDGCTVTGNAGRGIVITGNNPANPGETPYCVNARITNTIANKNSAAQNVSIRGSDIAVFTSEDVIIDGYSNTAGETYDPMDAGLIYIDISAQSVQASNLYFSNCNFTTNSKSLVYVDASTNEYRNIDGVYVDTCNGVIVSGGTYSNINNVRAQDCTGAFGVIVGTVDSTLSNVTLVNCPLVTSRNASGTGLQALDNITVINPVGDALRLYGTNSTYRNITVRNTGTASARAVWLESLTNCALDNWLITDAGGYWSTPANAYFIGQASLAGNHFDAITPSPLSGTATWDPANIASGGSTNTTVTLLRSDVGDPCVVKHSVSLQGLITFASTTAADTATVTLFNPTGGAINLASHTVSVEALK